MKKRTKKYNPNKQSQKDPDGMMENKAIFQLPNRTCSFIDTTTMKIIKPLKGQVLTPLANAFTHTEREWTVAAIVFRINSRGEKAIDVHHLVPPFPCKADQIADSVKEKHMSMVDKTPQKEFLATGWLASPRVEYHSSVKLIELFDKVGVWKTYVTHNGYVLGENNE